MNNGAHPRLTTVAPLFPQAGLRLARSNDLGTLRMMQSSWVVRGLARLPAVLAIVKACLINTRGNHVHLGMQLGYPGAEDVLFLCQLPQKALYVQ